MGLCCSFMFSSVFMLDKKVFLDMNECFFSWLAGIMNDWLGKHAIKYHTLQSYVRIVRTWR